MPIAAIFVGVRKGLVAAAEGWAVVGAVGRVVRVVGVIVAAAAAGATEGGLVAVLAVVDLALVFDTGEPGFDVVELRGGNHVVGTRRHDGGDLFFRVQDAVGGLGG